MGGIEQFASWNGKRAKLLRIENIPHEWGRCKCQTMVFKEYGNDSATGVATKPGNGDAHFWSTINAQGSVVAGRLSAQLIPFRSPHIIRPGNA